LAAKFTITYTGTIYTGKQDPSKLFTALRDLISGGTIDPKDVEVRFYGYKEGWLAREIEGYGLSGIVKQHGVVPRRIVFGKQKESQLLLLLNWEDPKGKGVYTLKIFEYLAAQRPILATGGSGDDVIKDLLDETKAGMYGSKVEDIKSILSDLYSEYKLKGKISYNGDRAEINKYSYREMAKKFAEILDSLTE
jgi:glycosyltransferase involved in cell wall biosynthesis